MWVLRDFSLNSVEINARELNADEYLEQSLSDKDYADESLNKNYIRQLIKDQFQNRKCFAFVQPHSEEAKLQNLNQLSSVNLRSEFREQVTRFRKQLFGYVKTKKIAGREISGQIVADLLQN